MIQILCSVAWMLAGAAAVAVLVRALVRVNVGWCRCGAEGGLRGQVVLITGANAGIGYETARELAARGARVLLACRSDERAAAARRRLLAELPDADLACYPLDLSSLESVRRCAAAVIDAEPRLHVLINNAGVGGGLCDRYTADGIVEQMQVNHFGPFLLTLLLLPLLRRSGRARVVTVASCIHYIGEIDLRRINVASSYRDMFFYANSKLCNVVFTLELARREGADGVGAHCLHPGISETDVLSRANWFLVLLFRALCMVSGRTRREAAQTAVHCAAAAAAAAVAGSAPDTTGQYYTERKARTWALLPGTRDPRLGRELWEYSERLVGYQYRDKHEDQQN